MPRQVNTQKGMAVQHVQIRGRPVRYIAASQLAVDGQIEYREIARSLLDLELGPDRPNVLLP
jgi:hypothetical protein